MKCGILGTNYPDMDMISFAQRSVVPIHLMKELVSKKILEILLEILENIPVK
jgi:dipeptidase D